MALVNDCPHAHTQGSVNSGMGRSCGFLGSLGVRSSIRSTREMYSFLGRVARSLARAVRFRSVSLALRRSFCPARYSAALVSSQSTHIVVAMLRRSSRTSSLQVHTLLRGPPWIITDGCPHGHGCAVSHSDRLRSDNIFCLARRFSGASLPPTICTFRKP